VTDASCVRPSDYYLLAKIHELQVRRAVSPDEAQFAPSHVIYTPNYIHIVGGRARVTLSKPGQLASRNNNYLSRATYNRRSKSQTGDVRQYRVAANSD
jgi:hypothetical protein